LFLKGEKCSKKACPINTRKSGATAPGQHGTSRRKLSEYGQQLREKQKAKRIYGLMEKQFHKYFEMAANMKGVTGENMLRLLEMRLDNAMFRMGYGRSRTEARQIVRHNLVTVNGKRINIPSYQLKVGDVLEIAEKSRSLQRFKDVLDVTGLRIVPGWIATEHEHLRGTVTSVPTREQITVPVRETLIVEFYSK
jgi:small subunit ribosomal protein S4